MLTGFAFVLAVLAALLLGVVFLCSLSVEADEARDANQRMGSRLLIS